jgi:hypothetical protein
MGIIDAFLGKGLIYIALTGQQGLHKTTCTKSYIIDALAIFTEHLFKICCLENFRGSVITKFIGPLLDSNLRGA